MKNIVCTLALIIISLCAVTSVKAICPIYKTSLIWQVGTTIHGFSTTELPCASIFYESPVVESVFVENATILNSGYAEGDQNYYPATLNFSYNSPNNLQTYSVFSDHFLVIYYEVYVEYWGGGWYWYDPWRFGLIGIGEGGYEGPDYFGGGYGYVYYWESHYRYIGSTASSITYFSGPPPPIDPVSGCSTGYATLGGVITSEPTAGVIGNKVVAFVRGTDNVIYYKYSSGAAFSNWLSLAGGTYQAPKSTVINGTLYVEVVGTDNNNYYKTTTDGVNYSNWIQGTGSAETTPSVSFNGLNYNFAQGQQVAQPQLCVKSSTDPIISSLSASIPSTQNPVPNSAPVPPGIYKAFLASTTFATEITLGSSMAVFQSPTDSISVIANGVTPITAATQLKWKLDRDPTDTVANGLPTLGQTTGIQTSITPNVAGNFRLICFYDSNNNGNYDPGEELKVLLFSIVRVTTDVNECSIDSIFPSFSYDLGESPSEFLLRSGEPMAMSCNVIVEGGGANRKIGLNKIHFGNVGNLINTSAKVNYASSHIATENPGGSLPMVDTGKVAKGDSPDGGMDAFREFSLEGVSNHSGGGNLINVTSKDAPDFGLFKITFPNTSSIWTSTEGGYHFKEFIAGFSKSFPKTYVVAAKADWTINYLGTQNGGDWINNGSNITLQGSNQTNATFTVTTNNGTPQSGSISGIQVTGLSYVNENFVDY